MRRRDAEASLRAGSKRHYHPRIYLATHIVFARLITAPTSQVLAFFTTVTAPLTRPIRALLPTGLDEARVRVIALAVYVVLWIATDWLARLAVPSARG